jgi:hypothetical protein
VKSRGPSPKKGDELLPANVARLRELGASFEWRRESKDICAVCPICGERRLFLDEEKPWSLCLGKVQCSYARVPFEELLTSIAKTVSVKATCSLGVSARVRSNVRRNAMPFDHSPRCGFESARSAIDRLFERLDVTASLFPRELIGSGIQIQGGLHA